YERLRNDYQLQPGGTIDVKGKGPMNPYVLIGAFDRPADGQSLRSHSRSLGRASTVLLALQQ
ncbi:MAG: hypothetical protein ACRDL8_20935, partial [Solirubrobacteraceae bacterium]